MSGYWRVGCPYCRVDRQTRIPSPAPLSPADTSTTAAVAEYWAHIQQMHREETK